MNSSRMNTTIIGTNGYIQRVKKHISEIGKKSLLIFIILAIISCNDRTYLVQSVNDAGAWDSTCAPVIEIPKDVMNCW